MSEQIDQEVRAIEQVLKALTPLSAKARLSVMEYVSRRLDLPVGGQARSQEELPSEREEEVERGAPKHIKELKEEKKPRSANEMAALVAYYLGNIAPLSERKQSIDQKDVETYFKIAGFPLPNKVAYTLPNAKAAGYFDAAGQGAYKLNAVGHNLVAHSMPRGQGKPSGRKKRASRSKPKPKPRSKAQPKKKPQRSR